MQLCSYAVVQLCQSETETPTGASGQLCEPTGSPLGGRALKNSPVGYFSEGARLQGRFVVEGLGVGFFVMQNLITAKL